MIDLGFHLLSALSKALVWSLAPGLAEFLVEGKGSI